MTMAEVRHHFGRECPCEYPCIVVWTGGQAEPGLLSTIRAESSYGLPVLVMRDDQGGERALGLADLDLRGGALLRRCDDDCEMQIGEGGLAAMESAARAGYGIALR